MESKARIGNPKPHHLFALAMHRQY